jgi:hypothetical protein
MIAYDLHSILVVDSDEMQNADMRGKTRKKQKGTILKRDDTRSIFIDD